PRHHGEDVVQNRPHSGALRDAVIELLGVGVPRKDGWLMHRVCARILRGEVSVVCSIDPPDRLPLLDALPGPPVPTQHRSWLSGRVARVRQLVARIDLPAPLVERRSVLWTCPCRPPRLGGLNGLFRFPRASERRDATQALTRVGLQARSSEPVSALDPLDRARLRLARSLWRDPEFLVVAEPESALRAEDASACVDLLKRLSREERVGVVMSGTPSSLLLQRADRVLDLSEGLLVFDGVPADFLRRLETPAGRGVRRGGWQTRGATPPRDLNVFVTKRERYGGYARAPCWPGKSRSRACPHSTTEVSREAIGNCWIPHDRRGCFSDFPRFSPGQDAPHGIRGELSLPPLLGVVQELQHRSEEHLRGLPGEGERGGDPGLHQPHGGFRGQRRRHDRRRDRQGAWRRPAPPHDGRGDCPRLQPG